MPDDFDDPIDGDESPKPTQPDTDPQEAADDLPDTPLEVPDPGEYLGDQLDALEGSRPDAPDDPPEGSQGMEEDGPEIMGLPEMEVANDLPEGVELGTDQSPPQFPSHLEGIKNEPPPGGFDFDSLEEYLRANDGRYPTDIEARMAPDDEQFLPGMGQSEFSDNKFPGPDEQALRASAEADHRASTQGFLDANLRHLSLMSEMMRNAARLIEDQTLQLERDRLSL